VENFGRRWRFIENYFSSGTTTVDLVQDSVVLYRLGPVIEDRKLNVWL